jgi:hypothetical protein
MTQRSTTAPRRAEETPRQDAPSPYVAYEVHTLAHIVFHRLASGWVPPATSGGVAELMARPPLPSGSPVPTYYWYP